jgi:hypothetical protein
MNNKTPTPRTDKVVSSDMGDSGFIVDLIKHSQQLERELNHALIEKEDIIRLLTTDGHRPKSNMGKTVLRYCDRLERQEKELIERDQLKELNDVLRSRNISLMEERDQLRKVCDDLYKMDTANDREFEDATNNAYNSLPHVVARKETK